MSDREARRKFYEEHFARRVIVGRVAGPQPILNVEPLKDLCDDAGLTIVGLAGAAEFMSASKLSNILNGHSRLTLRTAARLCRGLVALGIRREDIDELCIDWGFNYEDIWL